MITGVITMIIGEVFTSAQLSWAPGLLSSSFSISCISLSSKSPGSRDDSGNSIGATGILCLGGFRGLPTDPPGPLDHENILRLHVPERVEVVAEIELAVGNQSFAALLPDEDPRRARTILPPQNCIAAQ